MDESILTFDFNVNNYVYVKLTDLGRKIHREKHDSVIKDFPEKFRNKENFKYKPPLEDEEGWSKWQLWDLMNIFGAAMGNGKEPPFEMNIKIPIVKSSF